jgi:hypothetical protein
MAVFGSSDYRKSQLSTPKLALNRNLR